MIVCTSSVPLSGNMLRTLRAGFVPVVLSTYVHNEMSETS